MTEFRNDLKHRGNPGGYPNPMDREYLPLYWQRFNLKLLELFATDKRRIDHGSPGDARPGCGSRVLPAESLLTTPSLYGCCCSLVASWLEISQFMNGMSAFGIERTTRLTVTSRT